MGRVAQRICTSRMMNQFGKAYDLVTAFFGGNLDRAVLWFRTPNPMLGEVTPEFMIYFGRGDKLLLFIRRSLSENTLPCPACNSGDFWVHGVDDLVVYECKCQTTWSMVHV